MMHQQSLDGLQADYNRVELLYRSECCINLELQDILRANYIRIVRQSPNIPGRGFTSLFPSARSISRVGVMVTRRSLPPESWFDSSTRNQNIPAGYIP